MVNVVDKIPIVGQVLAPLSGVVRSGIGLVKDVVSAADAGRDLINKGDKLLSSGEEALKSKLEKGGNLAKEVNVKEMGKKAFKEGRNEVRSRISGM